MWTGSKDAALLDRIFGPVLAHVHAKTSRWHERLHDLKMVNSSLYTSVRITTILIKETCLIVYGLQSCPSRNIEFKGVL